MTRTEITTEHDPFPVGSHVTVSDHPDLGRAAGKHAVVVASHFRSPDHRSITLDETGESWGMHVNWLTNQPPDPPALGIASIGEPGVVGSPRKTRAMTGLRFVYIVEIHDARGTIRYTTTPNPHQATAYAFEAERTGRLPRMGEEVGLDTVATIRFARQNWRNGLLISETPMPIPV